MRLYLDVCCYSRFYDDQTQVKIYMESEAVLNTGDYTEEKYQKPDLTVEEIDILLKKR